jgi:uroporphyrin-3 C-methyltransferase
MSQETAPEGERRESAATSEDEKPTPPESAVEAGATAATTDPASSSLPLRAGARGALYLALLALVIAAVGGATSLYLWFSNLQAGQDVAIRTASAEATLQALRTELAAIDERLATLDARDAEVRAALIDARQEAAVLDERLDVVPAQIALLEDQVDNVIGGSFDSRARWLRAEAEYYLSVANTELELANNWENAIVSLELADDRLAATADPSLGAVRSLIAEELLALASVGRADIEGLSARLESIATRADTLPLREGPVASLEDAPSGLDEAEPGLGRFWQSVKAALAGIVRIERREESLRPALSAEERLLARRQLVVELQVARLALVRGEPASFAASLDTARALLEADFDTTSPAVQGALTALEELATADIRPEKPDISRSLTALRAVAARDD